MSLLCIEMVQAIQEAEHRSSFSNALEALAKTRHAQLVRKGLIKPRAEALA